MALEALREERTVQQIAARHGVHPNQVSQWKRKAREGLEEVFERGAASRGKRAVEAEIQTLHAKNRIAGRREGFLETALGRYVGGGAWRWYGRVRRHGA